MSGLTRIICHWTVTKYKCDDVSREHYHFIYEGDGTEIAGRKTPEDNLSTKDGVYAAHTLGCNTGSIGVSCAAMLGAKSVKDYGSYPITEVQFEAMCKGIARLCKKYGIPVNPRTVLSHAEVQINLGIRQRGKWDIAVLPFAKLTNAKDCGDYMRARVTHYLTASYVAPIKPVVGVKPDPAPTTTQAPKPAPAQPVPAPKPSAWAYLLAMFTRKPS